MLVLISLLAARVLQKIFYGIIIGDKKMYEKESEKIKSSLLHRNVLGSLVMFLPAISLIGGFFVKNKPDAWWYSISLTYYITPAMPVILGACSLFLLCYRSYDKIDTIINILSGIFAMCVVLFPCKNPFGIENVGYFQVPVDVSEVIHTISTMVLFALITYNIGWLFTRGNNNLNNKIYRICSYSMIAIMAVFYILNIASFFGFTYPEWILLIVETSLLILFGFAWLVKGQLFNFSKSSS